MFLFGHYQNFQFESASRQVKNCNSLLRCCVVLSRITHMHDVELIKIKTRRANAERLRISSCACVDGNEIVQQI